MDTWLKRRRSVGQQHQGLHARSLETVYTRDLHAEMKPLKQGRAPMTPKMYVGPISHNNSNNMTLLGLQAF